MHVQEPESAVEAPRRAANPAVIFETLNRYQESMALKGAIDLDLFTQIDNGATSAPALAEKCAASERGVRILCDYLTVLGFLTKSGERYGLPEQSALFLNRNSPAYMGSMATFLLRRDALESTRDVAATVRKGGTLEGLGSMEPESEVWVNFARSMMPLAQGSSRLVTPHVSQPGRKMKVLDIAAGHGLFGIAVAQDNPEAEIVAVDWANVLTVARENAAKAGVSERYHTIEGSAFDVELGSGYDLVLVTNFLHHFDRETNIAFLKKIRAGLNSGGRVATLEFVPNDDRISPATAAKFSLMMLTHTEHGDAYTFKELEGMFQAAGFGESRIQSLDPMPQHLILTER